MSKIDLSKYAGSYSIDEALEISERISEEIFNAQRKADLENARKIHGDNYTYKLRKGISVVLSSLDKNQSVIASSIDGCHILMTEK